jgi:hypothetical protein
MFWRRKLVIKNFFKISFFTLLLFAEIVFTQETDESNGQYTSPLIISIPQDIQERLKRLLSDVAQVGAKPAGESVFYGENLWEYIDGAAEAFHAYDFVALIHQDYLVDDAEVTVDIYDMGDPVLAFGMYSSERSPEYHFLDVGAEGYGDEFGLNFFQDRYYVKLSIFSESNSTMSMLETVARRISGKIEIGKSLPAIFSRFPNENRIPRSEQYIFQAPLGHSFLSPVFSVQYRKEEEETYMLMVVDTKSEMEAVRQAEKLADHFKQMGKIELIPEMGENAFHATSSYQTETISVLFGNYLFILKDPPDDGILFLREAVDLITSE